MTSPVDNPHTCWSLKTTKLGNHICSIDDHKFYWKVSLEPLTLVKVIFNLMDDSKCLEKENEKIVLINESLQQEEILSGKSKLYQSHSNTFVGGSVYMQNQHKEHHANYFFQCNKNLDSISKCYRPNSSICSDACAADPLL